MARTVADLEAIYRVLSGWDAVRPVRHAAGRRGCAARRRRLARRLVRCAPRRARPRPRPPPPSAARSRRSRRRASPSSRAVPAVLDRAGDALAGVLLRDGRAAAAPVARRAGPRAADPAGVLRRRGPSGAQIDAARIRAGLDRPRRRPRRAARRDGAPPRAGLPGRLRARLPPRRAELGASAAPSVGYLDAMLYTQWFNVLGNPAAVVPAGAIGGGPADRRAGRGPAVRGDAGPAGGRGHRARLRRVPAAAGGCMTYRAPASAIAGCRCGTWSSTGCCSSARWRRSGCSACSTPGAMARSALVYLARHRRPWRSRRGRTPRCRGSCRTPARSSPMRRPASAPPAGFFAGWLAMLDYLLIPSVAYLFSGIALHALVPAVPAWVVHRGGLRGDDRAQPGAASASRRASGSWCCSSNWPRWPCSSSPPCSCSPSTGRPARGCRRLSGSPPSTRSTIDGGGVDCRAVVPRLRRHRLVRRRERRRHAPGRAGRSPLCLAVAGVAFVAQTALAALLSPIAPADLAAQPVAAGHGVLRHRAGGDWRMAGDRAGADQGDRAGVCGDDGAGGGGAAALRHGPRRAAAARARPGGAARAACRRPRWRRPAR